MFALASLEKAYFSLSLPPLIFSVGFEGMRRRK